MSNTVKAKKDNGDRQVFSRLVWDNLPGDKYGWKEDNTPHEVPDEIKGFISGDGTGEALPPIPTTKAIFLPRSGGVLAMSTEQKQPAKPKTKNKQTTKA